jgi:predicted histidine transporter YuiF (NhaC family)
MEPTVLIALLALVGTLAGLVVTFRKGKDDSKNKTEELEANALQAEFSRNLELNKYIDGVVEAAVAPFRVEIAALKASMETVMARETIIKNIIRRWFQRLVWWDEMGRKGDMPMPAATELATLDLADIEHESTMSRDEVAAVRKRAEQAE